MSDAQDRGWGPGWPDCNRSKIKTLTRPDGLRLPVREEILPIVAYLMNETERRGYDIRPDWTWGFACRPIRGTQTASNHSWGLAVDINAPTNPMGSRLVTDMPGWMPDLWNAYMFRWGGDYRTRPDAMHYEFMGTPADAKRIREQIASKASPGQVTGRKELPLLPTDPPTKSTTGYNVQQMLNKWITKYKIDAPLLRVDGVYGPKSQMYVHAFKKWVIDLQKAFGLPQWPNTDTKVGEVTYGGLQFWSR